VVAAIYPPSLDATRRPRSSPSGNADLLIHGESLGLGGYLDIGLIDTMKE
jgi:hypothetical protein